MSSAYKNKTGKYTPINPSKYVGNLHTIVWRSLLELKVMQYFDKHRDVLEWAVEECIIPYISKEDGKSHRYFVDLYAKMKLKTGEIVEYLIEIKPSKEATEPIPQDIKMLNESQKRKYINSVKLWAKNISKWDAAKRYAELKGMKFVVITDKEINGMN